MAHRMHATLATHGTTGDVQPLLALALAWMRAGHEATLAAPPSFRERARSLGVPFVPLGPDTSGEELRRAQGQALATGDAAEQALRMVGELLPALPRMVDELGQACAKTDVLVGFPYQLAGPMVRDLRGVEFASIHFSPFGASANRRVAHAVAPGVNSCREALGLAPVADPLGADATSDRLAIFALSSAVFRRPRRWPPHHHLTGFLFVDEPEAIDPELRRFVEAGEPPIVITLGSMVHGDAAAVTAALTGAAERVGRRAVLQRGWSGLGGGVVSDSIFVADFVPHSWLFPRASCVVHAGGAGTTAAALRAGVPTVVIPHWLDQPLWAELARELGCAAAVVPLRSLSVEVLARGISDCLASERAARRSRELANQIALEDGASNACRRLAELVAGP